ncbi:DUF4169 family protein [Roseiarcaceae bacterium H3SJ34-1]|uniref:DUF4169 family protein n=1 Tax=Terripilifer ovatus TaxID=3032367 RepID=UPI003AB933DE|nr:DUF4169 family protein [Roseiarcaceae bacterium H3SJ34-1]
MGDVVNLRRARKLKGRDDSAKTAAANRLAFGRTKAEVRLTQAERELERKRIDAHRLQPDKREEPRDD